MSKLLGSVLVGTLAMLGAQSASAGIVAGYDTKCGTYQSNPCQSVNFHSFGDGNPVVGDTNPAPVYTVYVDGLVPNGNYHGSGQVVDLGQGPNAGFNSVAIRPEAPYAWTYIEFMLDSTKSDPGTDHSGFTLTVYDQDGVAHAFPLNFPWEGDQGTNQHYYAAADGGDGIVKVVLSYTDPNCAPTSTACTPNTIHSIENIDVASTIVPEPSTLLLTAAGLGMLGLARRRRRGA